MIFSALGWLALVLSLIFSRAGVHFFVDLIEADDPNNPAVLNGYHYPGAALLYAFFVSLILIIPSIISFARKESTRSYTLIYSIPALALVAVFLGMVFLGS